MPVKKEFEFEIVKEFATISTNKSGWNRKACLVSWNGNTPKFDLRDWSPDGSKMGKGISLTSDELNVLKAVLEDIDPGDLPNE